jgi:hypothetical protein
MPCEKLDHKTLHPWRSAGSSTLHHNVTHLAHLIPGAIEDWQASDA